MTATAATTALDALAVLLFGAGLIYLLWPYTGGGVALIAGGAFLALISGIVTWKRANVSEAG